MKEYTELKEYTKTTRKGFGVVQLIRTRNGKKISDIEYEINYHSNVNNDYIRTYRYNYFKDAYNKYDKLVKRINEIVKEDETIDDIQYYIRTAFKNQELYVDEETYNEFKERLKMINIKYQEELSEELGRKYQTLLPIN